MNTRKHQMNINVKLKKIKKSARIHKSRRVQIFSEVVLLTYWISVLEEFPKEISITK